MFDGVNFKLICGVTCGKVPNLLKIVCFIGVNLLKNKFRQRTSLSQKVSLVPCPETSRGQYRIYRF